MNKYYRPVDRPVNNDVSCRSEARGGTSLGDRTLVGDLLFGTPDMGDAGRRPGPSRRGERQDS